MSNWYVSQSLTFESDKITIDGVGDEVMMDWEHSIMSASAAYVTEGGGDILEIGFGMGISAGYIQSHSINSHTIVENHPQIIEKAKAWALDKPNVTIIEGSWLDKLSELSTYNGVFCDTYGDADVYSFGDSLSDLVKTGGVATWWNAKNEASNIWGLDGVEYEEIQIEAPDNSYCKQDVYYLPKKQF